MSKHRLDVDIGGSSKIKRAKTEDLGLGAGHVTSAGGGAVGGTVGVSAKLGPTLNPHTGLPFTPRLVE